MMDGMARRVQVWAGAGVTAVAVIGLGGYFAMVGLDEADKVASVVGGLIAVVGLAVAVYGVVAPPVPGRRVSQQARASGRGQVSQVGGHRHSGGTGPAAGPVPDRVAQRATASEEGSVTQTGGDQGPGAAPRP